jgi:hypothetical protein
MAAPSSPCGDPASAADHEDVHGGVEAMASGGTGRWQQEAGRLDRAPPPTGTGVIRSSSSAPVPGPNYAFLYRIMAARFCRESGLLAGG